MTINRGMYHAGVFGCAFLFVVALGFTALQSVSASADNECLMLEYEEELMCIDVPVDCTAPPATFCNDATDHGDKICTKSTGAGGTDCGFKCLCAAGPPCFSYAEECQHGCDRDFEWCFVA